MNIIRFALIAPFLCLIVGPSQIARGGGFQPKEKEGVIEWWDDAELDEDFKLERLPVPAEAARTWITLHTTMIKPLPDQTPLGEIIQAIKTASRGKDGKGKPIGIYIDSVTLQEREITLKTPIPSPVVGREEVSLHTYMELALKQHILIHQVHENIIIIEMPCDDCPPYLVVAAEEARIWLLLHERVPLKFPEETPLRTVLEEIHRAMAARSKDGRGVVIHADPFALLEAKKTLDSTVTYEMDEAPLCTSLGLILGQLGLHFRVQEDGMIVICEYKKSEAMDEATVFTNHQINRYEYYHRRRMLGNEILKTRQQIPRPDRAKLGKTPEDTAGSNPMPVRP